MVSFCCLHHLRFELVERFDTLRRWFLKTSTESQACRIAFKAIKVQFEALLILWPWLTFQAERSGTNLWQDGYTPQRQKI